MISVIAVEDGILDIHFESPSRFTPSDNGFVEVNLDLLDPDCGCPWKQGERLVEPGPYLVEVGRLDADSE